MILAIDPGTTESGWVLMDETTLKPEGFGKEQNLRVMDLIESMQDTSVVVEMVASYGQPVGKEIFDTCVWIGRFVEAAHRTGLPVDAVWRREEKSHIGGRNDAEIKRNLVMRFATFDKKTGKGTAGRPDWFYGFAGDVWQAYAVGVTWAETRMPKKRTGMGRTDELEQNVDVYPPFA